MPSSILSAVGPRQIAILATGIGMIIVGLIGLLVG